MTSSTSTATTAAPSVPASAPSTARLALLLGLLTAIGPFAIDMYLPALPAMQCALAASTDALQASLMAFYLALGAGQLVAGPLSDTFGRKRPLYAGLTLYVLASVGCAFATSVPVLVTWRLLQGLGACAAMVTPRAVVRDLHSGTEAVRLTSLLMTIYSVSPLLAPYAGSMVAAHGGWRAIFVALATAGIVSLLLVAYLLPETRSAEQRTGGGLAQALRGYGTLLSDWRFVMPALMASLTLAGFFIYVAGSPFVMSSHYGQSPRDYALLFGLNALPYVALAQANGWLARRLGMHRVARAAIAAQAVAGAGLWAMFAAGIDNLALLQGGTMLLFSFTGIILPTMFVTAMQERPALAGSASALVGTFNFAGGAVAMALAAPFADGTPRPMLGAIAVCGMLVAALAWTWRRLTASR